MDQFDDPVSGGEEDSDNNNFRHDEFEVSPLVPPVPAMNPSSRNSQSGLSPGGLPDNRAAVVAAAAPRIPAIPLNAPGILPTFTLQKRPYQDVSQQGSIAPGAIGATAVVTGSVSIDQQGYAPQVNAQGATARPNATYHSAEAPHPGAPPAVGDLTKNYEATQLVDSAQVLQNFHLSGEQPARYQSADTQRVALAIARETLGTTSAAPALGATTVASTAAVDAGVRNAGPSVESTVPGHAAPTDATSHPNPVAGEAPTENAHSNVPSTDRLPVSNIRDIVLGTASHSKSVNPSAPVIASDPTQQKLVGTAGGGDHSSALFSMDSSGVPVAEAMEPSQAPEKKKRRKKPEKPTNRVLVGKKEANAAKKVIEGALDLIEKLPERDARFLARDFWIFTEAQLEWVLTDTEAAHGSSDSSRFFARITKDWITIRLAGSGILEGVEPAPLLISASVRLPDLQDASSSKPPAVSNEAPSIAPKAAVGDEKERDEPVTSGGQVEESSLMPPPAAGTDATDPSKASDQNAAGLKESAAALPATGSVPSGAEAGAPDVAAASQGNKPAADPTAGTTANGESIVDGTSAEVTAPGPPSSTTSLGDTIAMDGPKEVPTADATLTNSQEEGTEKAVAAPKPAAPVAEEQLSEQAAVGSTAASETSGPSEPSHVPPSGRPTEFEEYGQIAALFVSKLDAEIRQAADAHMAKWLELIRQPKKPHPLNKRFILTGPVKYLLSESMRNFLASAKIDNVLDFLSLRKTETSGAAEMYRIWREKCKLEPEVANFGIAKYLLSVASRVSRALSMPPLYDPCERQWLMDPISVLTGAARDFIIDEKKIYSALQFVENMRTKEIAMDLEAWRARNRMVPLKGSGKVAMVSGWKAACREAILAEAQAGEVLPDVNLSELADVLTEENKPQKAAPKRKAPKRLRTEAETMPSPPASPRMEALKSIVMPAASRKDSVRSIVVPPRPSQAASAPVPGRTESSSVVSRPTQRQPHVRASFGSLTTEERIDRLITYTLHSTMFLHDVVGPDDTKLLASVHIRTAHDLFVADKKPDSALCQAIIGENIVDDPIECQMVIREWCQKLREEVEQLCGRGSYRDEPVPEKRKHASFDSSMSSAEGADRSSAPAKKRPTRRPSSAGSRRTNFSGSDPFEGLSEVTKKFLTSISITTAEELLSTRTTDIANEFIPWRQQEKMTELKGLGAIASVSGWKSQCRKIAKEMGWEEIADVEPENKASWGKEARDASAKRRQAKPRSTVVSIGVMGRPMTHQDALFGKSRSQFVVQSGGDPSRFFRFELSVRKAVEGTGHGLFITYNFSERDGAAPTSNFKRRLSEGRAENWAIDVPPETLVLSNVPVEGTSRASVSCVPFATLRQFCGLVDLKPYGVRPIQSQQSLTVVTDQLKSFVMSGSWAPQGNAEVKVAANVQIRFGADGRHQYLLVLRKPIEEGQTASLRFPRIHGRGSEAFTNCSFGERHALKEDLLTLSPQDLDALQLYLKKEVFPSLDLELRVVRTVGPFQRFQDVLTALRRLTWLSTQIWKAKDSQSPKDVDNNVHFDWQTFLTDPLLSEKHSEEHVKELHAGMAGEVKKELLAALELDALCGAGRRYRRLPWCKLASDVFDAVVEELTKLYSSSPSFPAHAPKMMTALLERLCSTPLVLDDCVAVCTTNQEGIDYRDARSLRFSEPGGSEFCVVCDVPEDSSGDNLVQDGQNTARFVLRRPDEIKDGKSSLSDRWYRQLQWDIAATVVSRFVSTLSPLEQDRFNVDNILSSMKESIEKTSSLTLQRPKLDSYYPAKLKLPTDIPAYEPHSFQFFLGLVWPVLRKSGWRLDAGARPSDILFIPPSQGARQQKPGAKIRKRRRDRERVQLQREVNAIGLGFVPRSTKLLFVNTISTDEARNGSSSTTPAAGDTTTTVKDALDKFLTHVKSGLKEDDQRGRDRAEAVVNSIRTCFDALAPRLVDDETPTNGQPPSEVLGCDTLMRFLLVLPSVLRQPGLKLKNVSDSLGIASELTNFLVANNQQLFEKQFHPPVEEYTQKEKANPYSLTSRLGSESSSAGDGGQSGQHEDAEGHTQVVLPTDKADVTDYVACVLEQTRPCRANEDDVQRKFRRINVGFPGLMCRHCCAASGEGRYFFTTAESMSASLAILDKHLSKCPSVPPETKSELVITKSRHSEQRKKAVHGTQLAFFTRLWDRLWASDAPSGTASEVFVMREDSAAAPSETESEKELSFNDHVSVMEYLHATEPWCNSKHIRDAWDRYYSCLEYGGSICHTSAMPRHFSAEWLLAKVAPKRAPSRRISMPG